jgi:ubiquinone/menaquinone biosynthesis C-methylase UbiE
MTVQIRQPSDLHSLNDRIIETYLNDFLADDSANSEVDSLLTRSDFQPDSFTVQDRLSNPRFLSTKERNGCEFLKSQIINLLEMLQSEKLVTFFDTTACADIMFTELVKLLNYSTDRGPIATQIFNQEIPDVVERVVAYCLYCNPNYEFHTHRLLKEVGLEIVPAILQRQFQRKDSLKRLLVFSIASGLVGLDLKGAGAAASQITSKGIPLSPFIKLGRSNLTEYVYKSLENIASKGLTIDYWNHFLDEVMKKQDFKLVWFLDDFIETMFDLYLLLELLEQYHSIEISLIPKNGQHGNDASYTDVMNLLELPLFDSLRSHIASGRLYIARKGPRMGTLNLMKLSKEVCDEIKSSNAVYIKGCRSHEMVQGGIKAVTYTSFVVAREFTEAETGLDARENALVFFRNEPGEYSYWGFKLRGLRHKSFEDGRRIAICCSTLDEHERRKTAEVTVLIRDLKKLIKLFHIVPDCYRLAYDAETKLIVDKLCDITKVTYNNVAQLYSDIRCEWPSEKDAALMDELIEMARARVQEGILGNQRGRISMLDVGTGNGRDLRYLKRFNDVDAIGIDNAEAFIKILDELAEKGEIPRKSYYQTDMRDLSAFPNSSFDVIRHNASLLHLPMLPNKIGADEAVAESFRVLKPSGLIYVLVKEGSGLKYMDTQEGLGKRVYQTYSEESIRELLERNGFRILEIRSRYSKRPTGLVKWLLVFAERSRLLHDRKAKR